MAEVEVEVARGGGKQGKELEAERVPLSAKARELWVLGRSAAA